MSRQANFLRQVALDARAGLLTARGAMLALAVGLALGGCAKSPTVILTRVDVDSTVPPIFVLRATLTSFADPSMTESASYLSLATGDASDTPGPYFFPLELPIAVAAPLTGAVTVTIEGLDYVTQAVVARGTGEGRAVNERQTTAAVVMIAVQGGGADGGTATADVGPGSDGDAAAEDGSPDL